MEEKEMTLAEALSANRTETRSEAVPDFDLERLSKEIDAVFQMKFKIGLDHVTEQSSRLVRDTDSKLTKMFANTDLEIRDLVSNYKEKIDAIFPEIKDRLLEEIAKGRTTIVLPTGNEIYVQHMDHPEMERVVKSLTMQRKVMLVGPAGTGKTTMVGHIAERLNLPFYKYSCSRDSSVHDLLGYKQPKSETYLETTFLKAYEEGGIFLVDEYDAMSGDIALFFNGVADNSKFISVPHRDEKPQAVKHKDFYLVMCGNTWGKGSTDYSGRDFQDMALMDRFRFCRHFIGYHELLEKDFMKHNYSIVPRLRGELEAVGSYLSTRNVEDIANLISTDVPFHFILDMVTQDLPEQDKKLVKEKLRNVTVNNINLQEARANDNTRIKDIVRDRNGVPYEMEKLMWNFPPNDSSKMMILREKDSTLFNNYVVKLKQQGIL